MQHHGQLQGTVIPMKSMTFAMMAKRSFNAKGVPSDVRRTVKGSRYGCGYSVWVALDYQSAINMLDSENLEHY